MKKITIILFCFVLFGTNSFGQYTVQSVPDPKKTGTGFVSNPDNILSPDDVTLINTLIQEVQDSSKAEIAVVVLQSIGDAVPKDFATELFNYWHIGNAETDNGLLILLVLDQHRVEFETGYETEQILPDAKCYEIQQQYMVPEFKAGNYGKGVVEGVRAVVNIFLNKQEEIRQPESTLNKPTNLYNSPDIDDSEYDSSYRHGFFDSELAQFYVSFAGTALFVFILLLLIAVTNKDYFARYQLLRIFRLYIWFILIPVPFVAIYFWVKYLTDKWRNTPRVSAKTGKIMHKLSETEDDKFLEKGQIAEELVKSIDYDVWVSGEEEDVLVQKYKRWFSKYNACPKCKYKTYYKVYDKTVTAATYSHSGTGERLYKCTNCGYSKKVTYTIPKKTRTSSSSSGSSSWSGGSSSWSSGGSSWGGGSSGGGGAGSSW